MSGFKVSDLKEASYNPRWISDHRLKNLKSSIEKFGDLSGVVFNERTKTLVSGHQRIKTIKKKESKIVTKASKDKFGTVAIGFIEVKEKGSLVKIPFRVVNWDKDTEKAANIAANAQGGQFDNAKLGKVLASIEKTPAFNVELLGLDSITVSELIKEFEIENAPQAPKKVDANSSRDKKDSKGKNKEDFDEVDLEDIESDLECQCPRCGYKFNN